MKIEEILDIKNLSDVHVKNVNPLILAFVGDAIHSLFVKSHLCTETEVNVNKLNKLTSAEVNAKTQALCFDKIKNALLEDEIQIAKRARNVNMHHKAKNSTIQEYRYATALEAILGYLYLTGREERLSHILKLIRCAVIGE